MLIIGCDFHPSFQQVAIFDNQTGEYQARRLGHREEAEQFYRSLAGRRVRVGMEACGHYPWFERRLAELGFELWLGDAAEIRARMVRQQKTDRVRSTNHGSTNRRDGWWDPASPARLKEHGLGLDVKTFSARAKWRCSSRLRRSVAKIA